MLAILILAALLTAPTPTPDPSGPRVPEGDWGGSGVRVRIGGSGAQIEFHCAGGTIAGPLRLDGEGRFDLAGTYERGHPGPVRMDQEPRPEPARYQGTLDGQTLTFVLTPASTGKPVGPFSAKLGAGSRIHGCL